MNKMDSALCYELEIKIFQIVDKSATCKVLDEIYEKNRSLIINISNLIRLNICNQLYQQYPR
jgi:hypothetical protein